MESAVEQNIKTNNVFSLLKYLYGQHQQNTLYMKRLKALKQIIQQGSLHTYFQPIVDLQTAQTIGFEALNRPISSELFTSVDQFYEFVGQTDCVFLFECFCRNLSLQRFMERMHNDLMDKNLLVFLNIHPNVLLDKKYHSGETLQLLKELGIKPQQVVFELTERSAVIDFVEFERVLSHYRSQGYRIAVDDVGSGYNSLKTLIYLKPEFIKLDRSLIQSIDQISEQQQLVTLLMKYAEQAKTKIIAEGIERQEELEYLHRIGIHYAQGYAIGKPAKEIHLGKIRVGDHEDWGSH
ncbi:EAL domain-containing protein [Lysinibacillus fusiformis]|uniref:EAL domain-containing protein n=1 Tax=Lysinibacillus fusiformis TaxID=28031 RepID=UPI0000F37C1C|nr:EAL domain-containing protein [Lysinibacillus fusiformis]EAZ84436.1 EAL domain/GGDEF domain protein [Bacillus sp. B14905]MED4075035.1 EAL domain-containing protein [Lysinibacillus fusiformis]PCD83043.1 EAL domain-containing protein [Lysinibacillus fusiformis]